MSSQTERHEEAMRLFGMLENMSESERRERLENDESELYSAPCSAMLATLVFKRLGVHDEDRQVFWTKLYGRSVGDVWKFYVYVKERPPEEFANLIGRFAKNKPSLIEGAA